MKQEITRFSNLVEKTSDCWLWKGACYRFGYGHFRRKINDKWIMYKAHRFAYEYYNGNIPKGYIIRHTCDNPKCVNPSHLVIGTYKDNVQDMLKRGRKVHGINPNHKQHKDIVHEIRKYKMDNPKVTGVELANLFKTSPAQISRIINNKIWNTPEEL